MPQFKYFKYNTEFLDNLLKSIKEVKAIIDSLAVSLKNLKKTLS